MDIAIIIDSQLYRLAAVILVVAGCSVVIISIIGIVGIRQENKCFLVGYIVTLIVIFCMVFVAGVFSVAIFTLAENTLEFQMLNTLNRRYGTGGNEDAEDPMTAAWNNIQGTVSLSETLKIA
ncbi:uncharacterized protein LOC117110887 [Anneissia japonica]|uniref:uncharacterized protein LOC117110887 n=1 Tax=Anneissia japonica TaxID=1529436 RepID=UPI0014259F4E|nr:uncharacterized protein LOC117110887 [Anneissia japonica]